MSQPNLSGMSIENSVKWITIPPDRNDLLKTTKELIQEVRQSAAVQLKLPKIDGSSELISKLDEILNEVEEEFDRIAATIHSSDLVHTSVVSLCKTVQKVNEFFTTLNSTKLLVFKKKGLKKKLALLNNDLRHRSTQITASLSLELLNGRNSTIVDEFEDVDLESRYRKGENFLYGIGGEKNYTLAFEHFKFAAERNHLKSMSMVADIYSNGWGLKADGSIACRWLVKAVEMGCIVAKYKLGLFLINEIKGEANIEAISPDLDELPAARTLFTGNSQSQLSPAEANSLKREEKFLQAVDLIRESAESGHMEALATLGQLYELAEDYKVAMKWYELAAAKGSLRATNLIGMLYYRGKGVPKLFETALNFFKQAARGGDSVACNNVAKCLEEGKGTERNVERALDMYKIGADNGSSEAVYSYGYLILKEALSHQIGVKQEKDESLLVLGTVDDYEEYLADNNAKIKLGVKYLRQAVEYGVSDAAYQLGRLYEQGVGVPFDMASAYSHYLWAAEMGHGRSSMCAANILYENTISQNELSSTPQYQKNMVTVAQLYHQAARSGIVHCMNALALLLEDGSGVTTGEPMIEDAAKWYLAAAEGGLLDAAGNLSFLLATHKQIDEVPSLDGHMVPASEIRIWLESLLSSPLIPSDEKFQDSVEKLRKNTKGIPRRWGDRNKKHHKPEGNESSSPKELQSSILFGSNSNLAGAIPILSSAAGLEDKYSKLPEKKELADNSIAEDKRLISFHDFADEKKDNDVEDKRLTIDGKTSASFVVNSNSPAEKETFDDSIDVETLHEPSNEASEMDNVLSRLPPLKGNNENLKSPSMSRAKNNKAAVPTASNHDKNSMRKMENLERLKSKKSEYSLMGQY